MIVTCRTFESVELHRKDEADMEKLVRRSVVGRALTPQRLFENSLAHVKGENCIKYCNILGIFKKVIMSQML